MQPFLLKEEMSKETRKLTTFAKKKIIKIMNENSLKIYAKHVFAIVTAVHSV